MTLCICFGQIFLPLAIQGNIRLNILNQASLKTVMWMSRPSVTTCQTSSVTIPFTRIHEAHIPNIQK